MRRTAGLVALALVAAACTVGETSTPPAPPSSPVTIPEVEPGGARTAAAAIRSLCVPPTISDGPPAEPGETPPAIREVQDAVEAARGLSFLDPPAVNQISDDVMDRKLEEAYEDTYPEDLYDRRTVAWRTIGVIEEDDDLHAALRAFLTGAVVGFYDPATGELVYLGDGDDLGLTEELVLAHELTHAIDDQHFDLGRLDPLLLTCRDEPFTAALGLVEGSAQYFATQVLLQSDIDLGDLGEMIEGFEQPDLSAVPDFLVTLQEWPYVAGQSFVTALASEGGTAAVDAAMEAFPVSTEQVIHPEKYPSDVPVKVDIGDISRRLGPAWGDLDAMQVGEEWLRAWLDLRLGVLEAREGAAGWDGGVYRAWTDGTDVVVVLRTAWDTTGEAGEFAAAVGESTGGAAPVATDGREVTVAFATDRRLGREALDAARSATITA